MSLKIWVLPWFYHVYPGLLDLLPFEITTCPASAALENNSCLPKPCFLRRIGSRSCDFIHGLQQWRRGGVFDGRFLRGGRSFILQCCCVSLKDKIGFLQIPQEMFIILCVSPYLVHLTNFTICCSLLWRVVCVWTPFLGSWKLHTKVGCLDHRGWESRTCHETS